MPAEPLSDKNRTRLILLLTTGISLTISWLSIRNSFVLSPDSLHYIFTAQIFLNHGLQAATESYHWPFLSILIAEIHNLTGLSLVAAGHTLIAILYAALSCSFILLTKDLGGSIRTQLLALVVISILPTLNDYRDYITRDVGFWLFTLLSIQQLLRYASSSNPKHAIGWLLFTLLAIGFRTEAIFFTLLAPLALLTDGFLSLKQRVYKLTTLYGLLGGITIIGVMTVIIYPPLSAKLRLVMEIVNFQAFFDKLFQEYTQTLKALTSVMDNKHAVNDMDIVFGTGLAGLVIYSILHALTIPYITLLGWAGKIKLFSKPNQKNYLIAYLIIILVYLFLFSFRRYFMTDRYCMAAVLILMLALPFCIEKIWANSTKFGWRRFLVAFLLLVPALDSLINTPSDKIYIINASEWIKLHKSQTTQLLTNHKQIAVLGGECLHSCFFNSAHVSLKAKDISSKHSLLAIQAKHDELEQLREINTLIESPAWVLTQTFTNNKEDKVFILTKQPPTTSPIE